MSFWLKLTFAFCSVAAVAADTARPEILDRIRDYDMRHSDLLVKIVRDGETLRYAKVRALERMSVIYRQSKAQGELVAPRYFEGITAGLVHKAPDVREAACKAGIVFNDSVIAPRLVAALAHALHEENHARVIEACARTLAVFPKDAEIILPALLARIDSFLAEYRGDDESQRALAEVCRTLGVIRVRRSFIPLLKVLQSRYDEDVKEVAQESIQAIRVK